MDKLLSVRLRIFHDKGFYMVYVVTYGNTCIVIILCLSICCAVDCNLYDLITYCIELKFIAILMVVIFHFYAS